LHARLLINAQDRLALRAPNVQPNDRFHLSWVVRVGAVAPHLHAVRLDLGVVQDVAHNRRADFADQASRDESLAEGIVRPYRSIHTQFARSTTCRSDDLVSLKRADLGGPTRAFRIRQSRKPLVLEAPQPLANTRSVRTQLPRNRRLARAAIGKQDHASTPVQTRLPALVSNDPFQRLPLPLRKSKTHPDAGCTRTLRLLY